MIYFKPKHFKASDGSHIPVLVRMVLATTGPILELGTGFYSTPLLHWLCVAAKRRLVSCESHPSYYAVALNYATDWHKIVLVDDWDKLDLTPGTDPLLRWSFVLVDHGPGPRRRVEFHRVANLADYIVAHDTEPNNDKYYHYSFIADIYRYRYDYTKLYPNTSVFSNFHSLEWLRDL